MLYHSEIYWKPYFTEQAYDLVNSDLRLSKHLDEHLYNKDKKHDIRLDKLFLVVQGLKRNCIKPFEVEVDENGNVVKCAIRTKYDDKRDISIVFRKDIVVTAWLNENDDKHYTLDKNKYENA